MSRNAIPLNQNPRRGLSFVHTYWLEENYKPAIYTITKIAMGCIYYKTKWTKESH